MQGAGASPVQGHLLTTAGSDTVTCGVSKLRSHCAPAPSSPKNWGCGSFSGVARETCHGHKYEVAFLAYTLFASEQDEGVGLVRKL